MHEKAAVASDCSRGCKGKETRVGRQCRFTAVGKSEERASGMQKEQNLQQGSIYTRTSSYKGYLHPTKLF